MPRRPSHPAPPSLDQLPLFPEETAGATPGRGRAVSASIVPTGAAPLSKDQKAFNALIEKIRRARARLAEWEQAADRFRRQYATDLLPLQEESIELDRKVLQGLDAACSEFRLTKTERRKLSALIVDRALGLLEASDDELAKALYNEYSGGDFDDEEKAEEAATRALFEEIFEVDLGDVDLNSPDDVAARMEQAFFAADEEQAPRPRSARQAAREQKAAAQREAEEKRLSQSIRDVYRKMASVLHPDREADPAERERKTVLMQQVNDAYAKGNLLRLLELQLELEQIDQSHLAGIDANRLRHYVKILKGQLEDLELELAGFEHQFRAEFGILPQVFVDARSLSSILQLEIAHRRNALRAQREEVGIVASLERLKAWLRTMRLSRRRP